MVEPKRGQQDLPDEPLDFDDEGSATTKVGTMSALVAEMMLREEEDTTSPTAKHAAMSEADALALEASREVAVRSEPPRVAPYAVFPFASEPHVPAPMPARQPSAPPQSERMPSSPPLPGASPPASQRMSSAPPASVRQPSSANWSTPPPPSNRPQSSASWNPPPRQPSSASWNAPALGPTSSPPPSRGPQSRTFVGAPPSAHEPKKTGWIVALAVALFLVALASGAYVALH